MIAAKLNEADIPYHLDASTALYVQGFDFEMDDLDVTVKWGCLEQSRESFSQYAPSPISAESPHSFHFHVNGLKVHVMTYESSTGIGSPNDRVQVSVGNVMVWTKTVEFYRRHMRADHPLAKLISERSKDSQN